MYPIGLSTCGKSLSEQTFSAFAKAGITHAEISKSSVSDYDGVDLKNAAKLAEENNVKLWSIHLPFFPFEEIDISCTDKEKRDFAVNYYASLIQKAGDVGIDKAVIHPSGEPIEECDRERRLDAARDGLYSLSQKAQGYGVTVCIEDLPRTCLGRDSDDILALLDSHPSLRVCFDTNHLLKQDNVDFIRKVADKIATLHVSDYDFIDERHWLCGEGKIDWQSLYSALKQAGYSGVWLYELGFTTPKSLLGRRSRDLTCEDFVRNANEIFEGKSLTII